MEKPEPRRRANANDDVERYARQVAIWRQSRRLANTENQAPLALETGFTQHVAALAGLLLLKPRARPESPLPDWLPRCSPSFTCLNAFALHQRDRSATTAADAHAAGEGGGYEAGQQGADPAGFGFRGERSQMLIVALAALLFELRVNLWELLFTFQLRCT